MNEQTQRFYTFGDYKIEKTERLLTRCGEVVPLPPKAVELLFVLLENNNHIVTKEELMNLVWADSFVEEANLSRNVFLLRKVLGEEKNGGEKFIETIPRRGYRFAANVTETNGEEAIEIITHERTVAHIVVEEEYEVDDAPKPELEAATQNAAVQISGNLTTDEKIILFPTSKPSTQSRPALISIGAILAVTVLLALGAYLWRNGRNSKTSSAPTAAMNIKRLTTNGKIVNAALSPDGKFFVYALEESGGQSLWVQQTTSAHQVNIAPPTKESYWGLTVSPDGEFVYCTVFEADKADLELRRIPILGGHVERLAGTPDNAVAFSPDGNLLAWIEVRGEKFMLRTAKPDGSDGRWLAERKYPSEFNFKGTSTAWSPDSATIACAAKDVDENGGEFMSIVGVDAVTGAENPLSGHRWASVNHLSWLQDGRLIVIASETSGSPAQIWSLSQPDDVLRQLTNDLNSYERLSAAANGEMFLSIQRNSVARLSATGENQAIELAPTIAQQVGSFDEIAWTSDGRIVYFSFADGETNLWLRDADSSNPRQLTNGMQAQRGLAVSPDNRHIVFAAAQNGGKLNLWRAEFDGRNLTRLTDESGGVYPTISPDGKWVIYQQGNMSKVIKKIPLAGGASMDVTEISGIRPQISPGGKLIAVFFIDDSTAVEPQWSIGIISAEDGEIRRKLTLSSTVNARFLRWTPDGKAIAYISSEGNNVKIIRHSLNDTEPSRPLTAFPTDAGMIQAFAWSPDGKQFAFTRESQIRDVVLLSDY